jgi:hypothetical protein
MSAALALLDYYWHKNWNFELEVGAQWTRSDQSGIRSTDTELFLTLGVRYDFDIDTTVKRSDGKPGCGTPGATALCRYAPASSERTSCASPLSNCLATPQAP